MLQERALLAKPNSRQQDRKWTFDDFKKYTVPRL